MKRELTNSFKLIALLVLISGCASNTNAYTSESEAETSLENTATSEEETTDTTEISNVSEVASSTEVSEENKAAGGTESSDENEAMETALQTMDANPDSGGAEDNPEDKITICMVGDILLHTPIEEISRNENGNYDFTPIFSEMKDDISSFDIAVVNEEVIIGGEELGISGYPAFNAPYEIGDALVDAGFDVICHATNHVLDKGKKGLINTCAFWDENYPDITVIGINDTPEDKERVDIIERNGIKIALLNYTFGTNGIPQPSDMPYAVDLLEENKVISDLDYAEANADFTVVFPHWGTEYRLTPDSYQEKWTMLFEEHGADLVLGTHPHVIEPIEFIDDKMLVYYSLGNFVNWTSGTGDGVTNRMVGGMAKVTLERNEDGNVDITDYGVKALVCHVTHENGGVTVFPLNEYPEELAADNEIISQDGSFSKDKCINVCNEVWGDLWD